MTANEKTTKNPNTTRLAVIQMGARAVKVVEKIAGGGEWTPPVLLRAADAFERGDSAYGLRRSWSMLAARLRNLATAASDTTEATEAATTPPRARRAKKGATGTAPEGDLEETLRDLDDTDGLPPRVLHPDAHDGIAFGDLCEAYLKHLEKVGKSRGTVFSYSIDLGVAIKHFGKDLSARTIRTEDVAEFYDCAAVTTTRTGKAKSDITIAKTRRVLRLALEWAASAGMIPVAPVPQKTAKGNTEAATADPDDAPVAGASA
jgi:hypothetical protein